MRTVVEISPSRQQLPPFAGLTRRLLAGLLLVIAGSTARAEPPQWIWSPAYEKEQAPAGTCYFRKTFELGAPEHGEIQIACDDQYELTLNGRRVGRGDNWKVLDVYDVTKFLIKGQNIIAIKATNTDLRAAGLVAQVVVKEQGGTHVTYSTDATWKTALKEFPQWIKRTFDDSNWLAAHGFGPLGSTLPWGNDAVVAGSRSRFTVAKEFRVEWVIEPKQAGSLIAMTFDEFGQMIASREDGPLLLVRDGNKDGLVDSVTTFCDEVKGCQGVLSVSGRVYAVGQGPQGAALYRLTDTNRDGKADRVEALVKFTGEMGEHGPHSLVLGPDGLLYIVVGNFSRPTKGFEPTSPHRHYYEGDLVTPRYEDAGGHAVGIKAPGGAIIRTDTSGSAVELVAGGLQNPYDLAFNEEGELFTWDSDMEWDAGMPWYRPTRLVHVAAGAEFGWRSGWAKWPDYYLDSLPPTLETGRGSPTGLEVYNHFMYPVRLQNAIFACDWSRGRILAIKTKPHGATYKAAAEVFLEGQPLNVTDIAVGPDGWLYFSTGGRGTEGGIYRVVWTGQVPPSVKNLGTGLLAAIRQPQPFSAWGRQRIALVKQKMGSQWGPELIALADNSKASVAHRARALDLMQLFGPAPSTPLLIKLSKSPQAPLRVKAAMLMALRADSSTQFRLSELLGDGDLSVQRAACEALVRTRRQAPADKVIGLLNSPDRYVAWAGRQAIARLPRDQWEKLVLESPDQRVFIEGAVALLTASPSRDTAEAVLQRSSTVMREYLNDPDFLDLLRVVQLALLKGKIPGSDVRELRRQLAEEYPSQDARMNRELVRLLVYLQEPSAPRRMVQQLGADIAPVEKMQVAMHTPFLKVGWTTGQKLQVLKFFEEARTMPGGHSFAGYVEGVSRDFFAHLTASERQQVLADGEKWPSSALSVLASLPGKPSEDTLGKIRQLDHQIAPLDTEAARRLKIGVAAVLGNSDDPQSHAYLRELFENEPDRRVPIAMGLAQHPEGENWPLLVRALSIVEGSAAQEVMGKLAQVDRAPDSPEPYRQVILRGLMLRDGGGSQAVALLEHWTDKKLSRTEDPPEVALAAWQAWFKKTYPDQPEPALPVESRENNWTHQELLAYLTGSQGSSGNPANGARVFEKAQCSKCHRYGDHGERIGPDLTTLSQRFQKKEILESILFPSQVIPDQYASQSILLKDGRTLTGLVSPAGDGSLTISQSDGKRIAIAQRDVESMNRSKKSSMPEGLLNPLTLDEIADLFAYLFASPTPNVARRPLRSQLR